MRNKTYKQVKANKFCFELLKALKEKKTDTYISIIGYFNEIKVILENIFQFKNIKFNEFFELNSPEANGYEDEYLVSFEYEANTDNLIVACEPLKSKDTYLYSEADMAFIFDNCCSKVLDYVKADVISYIETDSFDKPNESHNDCNCNKDCDCDKENKHSHNCRKDEKKENKKEDKNDSNTIIISGSYSDISPELIKRIDKCFSDFDKHFAFMERKLFRDF